MMLSTCACTLTSSAEVGSSHTRNSGCVASARAIEMRWRWPPENWCGILHHVQPAPGRPTAAARRRAPSAAPRSVMRPCSFSGSPTMSSTFQRGFRLAYGSWKIIWMRRRSLRVARRLEARACASWPSKVKPPRVGSYRPTSSRATVLLPQPDSPTSASVWPLLDLEADAVDGMQQLARLALDHAVEPGRRDVEGLGEVVRLDQRRAPSCTATRLGQRPALCSQHAGARGAGVQQVRALAPAAVAGTTRAAGSAGCRRSRAGWRSGAAWRRRSGSAARGPRRCRDRGHQAHGVRDAPAG